MLNLIVPGPNWPVTVRGYAEPVPGGWLSVVDVCFDHTAPQVFRSQDVYPDEDAAFASAQVVTNKLGDILCGGKGRALTLLPGGKDAVH